MDGPTQQRTDWLDMRSIQRLVDRVLQHPRTSPEPSWPSPAEPVLGPHWALADHDWHRRRVRTVGVAVVEELDEQLTRFALTVDGRLVRADRTRSVERRGDAPAVPSPWRDDVRGLGPRDVRALDRRPVHASSERGGTTTWGTQPTGEPFLSWPGSGLELLLKALVA